MLSLRRWWIEDEPAHHYSVGLWSLAGERRRRSCARRTSRRTACLRRGVGGSRGSWPDLPFLFVTWADVALWCLERFRLFASCVLCRLMLKVWPLLFLWLSIYLYLNLWYLVCCDVIVQKIAQVVPKIQSQVITSKGEDKCSWWWLARMEGRPEMHFFVALVLLMIWFVL
jgi:hypothetical protein